MKNIFVKIEDLEEKDLVFTIIFSLNTKESNTTTKMIYRNIVSLISIF